MRALSAALNHPESNLKFIHIAGTNGKGSVAAMCSAILKESGLKVGLYTSPHLQRYHERFRFNEKEISDCDLERVLNRVLSVAKDETFFEISTAVALCWFQECDCDVVVWETGLGGRLDATNVVKPVVSVITHIGMDHQTYLGDSLVKIAGEKAGIIKPHALAITIKQSKEVLEVLKQKAADCQTTLSILDEKEAAEFTPPLPGAHQRLNTALAVAACREARPKIPDETILRGLSKVRWPGRCQYIDRGEGSPLLLLDGAHNELGARVLVEEIQKTWGDKKVSLVFGVLGDKNVVELVRILETYFSKIFLVPVKNDRSAKPMDLIPLFKSPPVVTGSLEEALMQADRVGDPIVITGSLFLVGEALGLLTKSPYEQFHPNENLKPQTDP